MLLIITIYITRCYHLSPSLTNSLTLTHLLTHSLTHYLTNSLTHYLTNSLYYSFTHSLTHYLTNSLTHSLTHSQNDIMCLTETWSTEYSTPTFIAATPKTHFFINYSRASRAGGVAAIIHNSITLHN